MPVYFFWVVTAGLAGRKPSRNRLLIYYNFILTSIMAVMGFAGAKGIAQMISASLFLPLAAYFTRLVLPKRAKALVIVPAPIQSGPAVVKKPVKQITRELTPRLRSGQEFAPAPVQGEVEALDANKRLFLKLIGSAGMSLLFFSLFTKKTHAAFFGSVPGPGTVGVKDSTGTLIDPAVKHPTDGYRISDMDDTVDPPYAYYGFINKDGAWFIMREDSSNGEYRYRKGSSGFSAGWTAKTSNPETYGYYDAIFD